MHKIIGTAAANTACLPLLVMLNVFSVMPNLFQHPIASSRVMLNLFQHLKTLKRVQGDRQQSVYVSPECHAERVSASGGMRP